MRVEDEQLFAYGSKSEKLDLLGEKLRIRIERILDYCREPVKGEELYFSISIYDLANCVWFSLHGGKDIPEEFLQFSDVYIMDDMNGLHCSIHKCSNGKTIFVQFIQNGSERGSSASNKLYELWMGDSKKLVRIERTKAVTKFGRIMMHGGDDPYGPYLGLPEQSE